MTDIIVTLPWWVPTAVVLWVSVGAASTAMAIVRNKWNGYDPLDGLLTSDTMWAILAGPVTLLALLTTVAKDGWIVYDDSDDGR